MNCSDVLNFNVGKVKGSCLVNYYPGEYEGWYLFSPEDIEFTYVDVNGKRIPFEKINTVLNNIMLEAFEEYLYD